MDRSDRRNWYLSTAVGILLAANAIARVPRAAGVFEWVTLIALAVGGLLAMANGVRALREPGRNDDIEWTQSKTRLNAAAILVLGVALLVQLYGYVVG